MILPWIGRNGKEPSKLFFLVERTHYLAEILKEEEENYIHINLCLNIGIKYLKKEKRKKLKLLFLYDTVIFLYYFKIPTIKFI